MTLPLEPSGGGGYRRPYRIGPLLRDIMVELGDQAYPWDVHARAKQRIRALWEEAAEPGIELARPGRHQELAYISVGTYLNTARRLGLVEYTGATRPSTTPHFADVRFIRVVPGMADDPAWLWLSSGGRPPEGAAERGPAPPRAAPQRHAVAREAPALPLPVEEGPSREALVMAWSTAADRINGYKRPNSAAAERVLDAFVQQGAEAGWREDDLEDLLSDQRAALQDYKDAVEDSELEPEDRAAAWEVFTDSLNEVDFSELEE